MQIQKNETLLIISLANIFSFLILAHFSSADDNALTSWQWVLRGSVFKLYLLLIVGVAAAYIASRASIPAGARPFLLFILSFASGSLFWSEPEVIVDSSRYFMQAKYLELFGVKYFASEWGGSIGAWTDMPLVPFLYGLLFRIFGESRIFIQAFNTVLFSLTAVLTYLAGKKLWDDDTGFYGALLLLGIPYLFTQVPLMLVDIPALFFFMLAIVSFMNAMSQSRALWIILSAISIFLSFLSKYTAWPMLSVLIVIFAVYFQRAKPAEQKKLIARAALVYSTAGLLIAAVVAFKFDVFSEQIVFLFKYQRTGLRQWGESFVSIFLFQTHPFITLAALFSLYAAVHKRDFTYAIASWCLLIAALLQINRIRYLIIVFPLFALTASYGLMNIKDELVKRFIVFSVVASSLVIAVFAYLPSLRSVSESNLAAAGQLLDSLDAPVVEVVTVQDSGSLVNQAVSVPVLDLFTNKEIRYAYEALPLFSEAEIAMSPFRFTWEYKNPVYYRNTGADEKSRAVISGYREDISGLCAGYRHQAMFNADAGVFRHRTFVTVCYNEEPLARARGSGGQHTDSRRSRRPAGAD